MRRTLPRLVAILAVGALLTGCFALRGFDWSVPSIAPGETTVAELTLRPGAANSTTDIPFVLIGLPPDAGDGATSFRLSPGVFDRHGAFNGPTRMISDDVLLEFVISPGNCTTSGEVLQVDAALLTEVVWRLRRVPEALADEGRVNDAALTKIAVVSSEDTPAGTPEFAFFSGRWADTDEDGVPEDNEVSCTGLMYTSLPVIAPAPTETPTSE